NVELERKVLVRTRELEEANAAKTQFVANISHDIRNPLNGIVGLALALEDTKLDPRQKEIVSTLHECTTYLSSLVDDVLDFASIEAGKVELRPGAFPPAGLLNSIVNTLKSDSAERGATILVEADPDLPPNLMGDAGRIQQILVNYVSNALKYAGGHIRLSAAVPPDAPEEVEFAVIDEGPGISEADQATLFRKFSRLSRARQSDIPGSGLGLASCRLLADIMGGSIGVSSTPGEGARFYLRLPLVAAVAPPAELPAANLPNTTVLLVEDTDYNALAATAVLRRLGLTCERACTGAEALRLFSEKRYNIVLLDRNLPDMDGTDVARRMREIEADGSHALLLAVTAYCTSEDRELCLKAGMDAFVGKPLTPDKLRKVIRTAGQRMLAASSLQAHDVPSAGGAAPAASPAFDMSLLHYLADDSPQGLGLQVGRFVISLSGTDAAISAALSSRDYPALAVAAHELLGQARMVGAAELAEAAMNLEAAARNADASGCSDLARAVVREIERLTAALRRHRSAGQTA
ncbi:MAG: ATP-binding protein, partial [Opitutus sp.]